MKSALVGHIPDPLESHLSLLLHRLIIIRRGKHSVTSAFNSEKLGLAVHEAEQPVPLLHVVAVDQLSQILGVEFEARLGGRVVEAWGRLERRV